MSLKSNGLLKVLLGVAGVMAVGVIGLAFSRGDGKNDTADNKSNDVIYLSEEDAKELGLNITGDTPQDTLKTLLGAMKATRDEVKRANEKNARLEAENKRLANNEQDVNQRIDQALGEQYQSLTSMFQQQFAEFQERLSSTGNASSNTSEEKNEATSLPIGGGQNGFASESGQNVQVDGSGTIWLNPTDMRMTDRSGNAVDPNTSGAVASFPTPFKAENGIVKEGNTQADTTYLSKELNLGNGGKNTQRTPFYTIPDNSTLMGATAMTALLGRIPINGAVTDAYPFKVIIGRENLMANGIDLPDIEGAIVSGTASGDWTLSCVRADVKSITFIFQDGRISNSVANKNGSDGQSNIGWLSNPQGVQCIPGERKTNAPEYLTSQFLLAGAGAAANGFAQGQTTSVVQDGSVVGAVTGSQGRFILGQALSGGLQEVENWYRQRYGQMFDAIYVKPGQEVAVHITQQLEIDYDTGSRKVKYNHSRRTGGLD